MLRVIAVVATGLLVYLGIPGAAGAQAPQPVVVQGTVQSVDCGAGRITVQTSANVETFQLTPQTAVFANGARTPLCGVRGFIGSPVWLLLSASGDQFVVGRIDVGTPAAEPGAYPPAAATPPPYYAPPPGAYPPPPGAYPPPPATVPPSYYVPPSEATVLGAVVLGGTTYLVVNADQPIYYWRGVRYRAGRWGRCYFDGAWRWCRAAFPI